MLWPLTQNERTNDKVEEMENRGLKLKDWNDKMTQTPYKRVFIKFKYATLCIPELAHKRVETFVGLLCVKTKDADEASVAALVMIA